eukprot:15453695-Alexandrium_andersonii.AAC.1
MTSLAARGSKSRSAVPAVGALAAARQQVTEAMGAGWTYCLARRPLSAVTHGPASTWEPGA